LDYLLMLAAPVMRHQRHLLDIGLIQGRVIQDQKPLPQVHEGFLESSLVKASWAGAFFPSGAHLAASVQVKTFWEAMRKWM